MKFWFLGMLLLAGLVNFARTGEIGVHAGVAGIGHIAAAENGHVQVAAGGDLTISGTRYVDRGECALQPAGLVIT